MRLSNYKTINAPINGKNYRLWVADSDEKRTQGLSGIKYLPENFGMIFVYKNDEPRTFTMKNTNIPLRIAFFNKDFKILHCESAEPRQTDLIHCDEECRYVIEIRDD